VRIRINFHPAGLKKSARRALARSSILRATSTNSPIPFSFYQSISQNLSKAFAEGTYLKDGPPKQGETQAPPNPLSDPATMDGMMAGMRTQMVMMVPQMIVMGWINFFFEGFVLSACCPNLNKPPPSRPY
jgi:ER membrane protein complex subunit 3